MGRAERKTTIEKLQRARDGRLLLVYVTSTRQGYEVAMADDVLRLLYEHLEAAKDTAKTGVDLFIHSNGGHGTVPWRIASLIREYTDDFAVLVPHRAFSAATLLALGAHKIVMHRMGCLGPIDPSVANAFNPPNPHNPGAPLPISVEDVSAYFKLVKDEVGISHEDELVQALTALTEKIHPLALGNVQRSHNQSRLMAKKLLLLHMNEDRAHEITKIIDTLKSNLFFHGHPINRDEAEELGLRVEKPPEAVEELMWKLYLEYEVELKLNEPFQPLHEIETRGAAGAGPQAPLTTQAVVQQMQQLAQMGIGLGAVNEEQFVRLAAEMQRTLAGTGRAQGRIRVEGLKGAFVESAARCDTFKGDLALETTTVQTPAGPTQGVKQEMIWHRWETE